MEALHEINIKLKKYKNPIVETIGFLIRKDTTMESWLLYALLSAVFAAATTILAKIGLNNVDSHLATAIRTMVVLTFAWIMVFIVGSHNEIGQISRLTWVFLILSGLSTGGAWLCRFRALKLGSVNKVVPIDKSSTILTILFAVTFLSEPMSWLTIAGIVLIAIGTWLMIDFKKSNNPSEKTNKSWIIFACLAAIFASLTAIFGRVGVIGIEANLWTAIRTTVVVPLCWIMVSATKGNDKRSKIDIKSWVFLVLSGIATGGSWLFFYHALQIGNASLVVPVDKLSIVFVMIFARVFLGERFSRKSIAGLALLVVGILLPVVF